MKLDMIGIVTKDMEQATLFYETLGFSVIGNPTTDYLELDNQGVRISLNSSKMIASIYGYEPATTGDTLELAFLCDSIEEVDETHRKMTDTGYEIFKAPWNAFWGQRYLIIKDIDGNFLSIFANLPS